MLIEAKMKMLGDASYTANTEVLIYRRKVLKLVVLTFVMVRARFTSF